MGFVASSIGVAQKRHLVTLDAPTTAADGDGGYVESWTPLDPPALNVNIRSVSAGDLERLQSGTVSATATHILTGDYHAGVTTKTRVSFGTRRFSVVGVSNPEEGRADMELYCAEKVQ